MHCISFLAKIIALVIRINFLSSIHDKNIRDQKLQYYAEGFRTAGGREGEIRVS